MSKPRRGIKQRQGSKQTLVVADIISGDNHHIVDDAAENDVIVTAELISVEPEEQKLLPIVAAAAAAAAAGSGEPAKKKWFSSSTSKQGPLFPRSRLGQIVRLVKILLFLLNMIVIRGSVLTRRKLDIKLEEYQQSAAVQEHVVAFYNEHISHHLFVFYLSWCRLIICSMVLMWGTCDRQLPHPWVICLGMLMHWIDSLRVLDSSNWLPVSHGDDDTKSTNRESSAEEEVQTAMAWLHLFWFILDGFYCRQILQRRKVETFRKEHGRAVEHVKTD